MNLSAIGITSFVLTKLEVLVSLQFLRAFKDVIDLYGLELQDNHTVLITYCQYLYNKDGAMRNTERKPCDNAVVKRIELSMKNRGLNQKQLMKALDLPVSVFTQWKYDNGKSYTKYIDEISKILDVSSEYLLSGKEKIEPQISHREEQLLRVFRQLPDEIQDSTMELMRSILLQQEKKTL